MFILAKKVFSPFSLHNNFSEALMKIVDEIMKKSMEDSGEKQEKGYFFIFYFTKQSLRKLTRVCGGC